VKAIESGNPAVLTLAEAEAEVQRLSVLKKAHADEEFLARRAVRDLPAQIARLEARLASLRADSDTLLSHAADPVEVNGRRPLQDQLFSVLAAALNGLPD
jgi:hypothetical protein